MKVPLMMPSYLCGECGIEMLLSSQTPQERAAARTAQLSCYTPRCPQKGVRYEVTLVDTVANRIGEDSTAT